MFYRVEKNRIKDYADYEYDSNCKKTDLCTFDEYVRSEGKYIIVNGVLALNPNYEEYKKEKRAELIKTLKITKRVFALALRQLGISYLKLKELIATDEQAQLEWDLCEKLHRSNSLLDTMGKKLGITSEQIDDIFSRANEVQDV